MDEYISEIFMNGTNTIVCHNTCEDSLLASPLILDLVILAELCERITVSFYPAILILIFINLYLYIAKIPICNLTARQYLGNFSNIFLPK